MPAALGVPGEHELRWVGGHAIDHALHPHRLALQGFEVFMGQREVRRVEAAGLYVT